MAIFTKSSTITATPSATQQRQESGSFFGVQAKLTIGKANDKYEKEADSVADKVVAKTESTDTFFGNGGYFAPSPSPSIQRVPFEDVQKQEGEDEIQEKPLAETITPVIQLASDDEETQRVAIQELSRAGAYAVLLLRVPAQPLDQTA